MSSSNHGAIGLAKENDMTWLDIASKAHSLAWGRLCAIQDKAFVKPPEPSAATSMGHASPWCYHVVLLSFHGNMLRHLLRKQICNRCIFAWACLAGGRPLEVDRCRLWLDDGMTGWREVCLESWSGTSILRWLTVLLSDTKILNPDTPRDWHS